jgi:hypothetical protein
MLSCSKVSLLVDDMRFLSHARSGGLKAMKTSAPSHLSPPYKSVKLGIEAPIKYCWARVQIDGAPAQRVQKITRDELLLFVVE